MLLNIHIGAGTYRIVAQSKGRTVTHDLAKLDREGRREARAQVNSLWRQEFGAPVTRRRFKHRRKAR